MLVTVRLPALIEPRSDTAAIEWHKPFPVSDILDVAGSLYAARSNELFLLSDSANRVFRLSLDALDDLLDGTDIPAALLRPFAVPGVDQEGICVVEGSLIIAQDSGDLYDAGPLRELLRR